MSAVHYYSKFYGYFGTICKYLNRLIVRYRCFACLCNGPDITVSASVLEESVQYAEIHVIAITW